MKIGIIGAGAVGLLSAFYLASTHDVTIYTRTLEQAKLLESDGLQMERGGNCYTTHLIQAKPFSAWANEDELTVVTVKQYQLETVVRQMAAFGREHSELTWGSILFLQNGMGHLELLHHLNHWQLFLGTVEHGALRLLENKVAHTGIGTIKIASYTGDLSYLRRLLEKPIAFFPLVLENNYEQMLVSKLTVNAIINPLTAVLRERNGALVENPYYFSVLKKMFEEVHTILQLTDKTEAFKHIVRVCKQTAKNKSSMLKDTLEGRPTEIDAILGYLLSRAEKQGQDAPIIELLYALIKGSEFSGEEG